MGFNSGFKGLITHASKTFVRLVVAPRFLTVAPDRYGQLHDPVLCLQEGTLPLPPTQAAGLAPETVWKLDTVNMRKMHCLWREINLDKHILVFDEIFKKMRFSIKFS